MKTSICFTLKLAHFTKQNGQEKSSVTTYSENISDDQQELKSYVQQFLYYKKKA